MRLPFSLRLAVREGRSGFRRVGWFLGAVALGVASLVALYGFQRDAASSARAEARDLLGGDLRFQGSSPFEESAEAILDSLAAEGARISRGTSLASVVLAPATGLSRLLQVNAVDEQFPAAGEVVDTPSGAWARLAEGGGAVADPSVFAQLGVEPGDSVRVGTRMFEILGSASGLPVDFGMEWVTGPPLYILRADLESTGLSSFGSLAQYRAWVSVTEGQSPRSIRDRVRTDLRAMGISVETAQQEAEGFAQGFEYLSRFLGLVGLLALLLGGIGVGSAVQVYVRERLPSMAVLRCLGTRRATLIRAYLFQAAALGATGSIVGVAAGVGIQFALPVLLADVLPFSLTPRLHPEAALAGLLLGTWVAVLFSLLPLLRVGAVSPLQALRADVETGPSAAGGARGLVFLVLLASLVGLCALQLGDLEQALVISMAVAVVLALLAATALALGLGTRRAVRNIGPFPLRQGLSGLFRPGNQTGIVVTALGLGAFLMGTLLVVESRLRAELAVEFGSDPPRLVLFDIQRDQVEGVTSLLRAEGLDDEVVPIVPARIEAVGGRSVDDIRAERRVRGRWMYDRLYRNTYRAERGAEEQVVQGRWWDDPGQDPLVVQEAVARGAVRVSLEQDLAEGLGLGIGGEIMWDVQGVSIPTVISSLRTVEWSSIQPNFFAVFEPGSLDDAPATFVSLSSQGDPDSRLRVQEALIRDYPNVSFLDISLVQETLERLGRQVALVFRAVAGFILGGGTLVLFAALLTSRFRRRRETALLKTLGARSPTIRGILLSEYAALGGIGAAAGLLLGGLGATLLLDWQFELDGTVPLDILLLLWTGILLLAVAVGWSVSGPVLRATPLETLRAEAR